MFSQAIETGRPAPRACHSGQDVQGRGRGRGSGRGRCPAGTQTHGLHHGALAGRCEIAEAARHAFWAGDGQRLGSPGQGVIGERLCGRAHESAGQHGVVPTPHLAVAASLPGEPAGAVVSCWMRPGAAGTLSLLAVMTVN